MDKITEREEQRTQYTTVEEAFKDFAMENGINLEYEEDWGVWWDCFLAGFKAGGCS